jgi:hypothetical protein
MFQCTRNKDPFSRSLKLRCLKTIESLLNKARQISLPGDFKIPDFSILGEGLTQEQYMLRRITELETEIEVAGILR